jgi:hypothetical protein
MKMFSILSPTDLNRRSKGLPHAGRMANVIVEMWSGGERELSQLGKTLRLCHSHHPPPHH